MIPKQIVIVCGHYSQGRRLAQEMALPPLTVTIISDTHDLVRMEGLEKPTVIFTGTWFNLTSIDLIRETCLVRRATILEHVG